MITVFQGDTGTAVKFELDDRFPEAAVSGNALLFSYPHTRSTISGQVETEDPIFITDFAYTVAGKRHLVFDSGDISVLSPGRYVMLPRVVDPQGQVYTLDPEDVVIVYVGGE